MKKLSALILIFGITTLSYATGFVMRQAGNFTFIYREDSSEARIAADELAFFSDEVYDSVTSYFGIYPENVQVVISDKLDIANAYFTGGRPHINILTPGPKSAWAGALNKNWYRYIFIHEFTHYVHLCWPSGPVYEACQFFGPGPLFLRNASVPGWALEGITTYLETSLTDGGRGRNPFFELYYKAPIIENNMFTLEEAGFNSPLPPRGRIYVAGYMIVSYLSEEYGHDVFKRIVETQHNDLLSFTEALEKVTGESLENIFIDMKTEQTKKYAGDMLIKNGTIISPRRTGNNYYLPQKAGNSYYSFREKPDENTAIVRFTEGKIENEEIIIYTTLPTPSSFCVDKDETFLYFISGEFNRSLTGLKSSKSSLVRLDIANGRLETMISDIDLYDLTISPDGRFIAAAESLGSYSSLVLIDTQNGEFSTVFTEPESSVFTPSFSPDGNKIVFSANFRGMQDLYLLNIENREYGPLFTTDYAGDYNPQYSESGSIIFCREDEGSLRLFEYTGEGNPLHLIAEDPVAALNGIRVGENIVYGSYSSQGFCVKFKKASASSPGNTVETIVPKKETIPPPFFESEEYMLTDKNSFSSRTEKETSFLNFPLPFLWLPLIDIAAVPGGFTPGAGITIAGLPLSEEFLDYNSFWTVSAAYYWETKRPAADAIVYFSAGPADILTYILHNYEGYTVSEDNTLYTETTSASTVCFFPIIDKKSLNKNSRFSFNTGILFSRKSESSLPFELFEDSTNITTVEELTAAAGFYLSSYQIPPPLSGVSCCGFKLQGEYFFDPLSAGKDKMFSQCFLLDLSGRFPIIHDILIGQLKIETSYTIEPTGFTPKTGPSGFSSEANADEGGLLAGIKSIMPLNKGIYCFAEAESMFRFTVIDPAFEVDNCLYFSAGSGFESSGAGFELGLSIPYQFTDIQPVEKAAAVFLSVELDGSIFLPVQEYSLTF